MKASTLDRSATSTEKTHGKSVVHSAVRKVMRVNQGGCDAVDSKSFTDAEDRHAGNCTLHAGATMTFFSDGGVVWNAVVSTSFTYSGDEWHLHWEILDSQDRVLASFSGSGPNMPGFGGGSGPIPWTAHVADLDPRLFPQIAGWRWTGTC